MDEIEKVVREAVACGKASTVEELIACLDQNPELAAHTNAPTIYSSPPPIQLVAGKIMGPCEGECVAPGQEMTRQQFANLHVRDLAHTCCLNLMAPTGTYYRWIKDRNEPALVSARTIRPSYNDRAKRPECGLAAAEGPWLYGLKNDYNWCYFVSGRKVCRGSDDEPVLDVNTLEVASEIMGRKQLFEEFYDRNKERLSSIHRKTGVKVNELYALFIGISPESGPLSSS